MKRRSLILGLCTFIASIRSCNGLVMFVYVGGNAKFFCAFDGLAWNFMDGACWGKAGKVAAVD